MRTRNHRQSEILPFRIVKPRMFDATAVTWVHLASAPALYKVFFYGFCYTVSSMLPTSPNRVGGFVTGGSKRAEAGFSKTVDH